MNTFVPDDSVTAQDDGVGTIRRRHVVYVEGYDPLGTQWYFDLFRRTCERSQRIWPITLDLQPLEIDTAEFAHWDVDLRGSNWQTATRYDFVRMERFIRADMDQSTARQLIGGLRWCFGDLLSGTLLRIWRAGWRFVLHLLYFQALMLVWLAGSGAIGVLVGYTLSRYAAAPMPATIVTAALAALVSLVALRPLAEKWRVTQFSSCWVTLRKFGRGEATWLDQVIESAARRVVAAAKANEADELAVVGHSTGGVIAAAIAARALELDPDLGKSGPRLVLLTLGSVMPAVAVHPAAHRMRTIVSRLATAHDLAWIDCQASKDVMCFADFDPVGGIGLHVGEERCNPLCWPISFKDMIAPANYARFRRSYLRMHYQYIMAGDRPAPYDYLLLVGGPMPIAEWPKRSFEFMAKLLGEAKAAGERHHDTVADTAH
jgi:pimeloyl-ACP methyl ester carboxylesterase